MKKVAIIGSGPSGVYCAINLEQAKNLQIDIFEKSMPLKTILPTGGTRCNITHWANDVKEFAKNYPRGEKFLYSIFHKHFVQESLETFSKIGIKTYMQEDERYFPKSNSSKDVREKMLKALKRTRIIKRKINSIKELNDYDFIVLACGTKGVEELLLSTEHKIIPLKSALCGLKLDLGSPKYPQGVVLNTKEGEILFTKEGVSGPLIYKISSINAYKNFPYDITVDLLDTKKLENELKNNPKKSFGNIVSLFIPKSLAQVILNQNFDKKCANVSKSEIENLKTITFRVISTDNKGEIVHAGGICLDEVTNFCQSKLNPKLFFCGEVLDIDGFCGGYNLQNCWSSAYCVALKIKEMTEN